MFRDDGSPGTDGPGEVFWYAVLSKNQFSRLRLNLKVVFRNN